MTTERIYEMIKKVEAQIEKELKDNDNEPTAKWLLLQGKREALSEVLTEMLNA